MTANGTNGGGQRIGWVDAFRLAMVLMPPAVLLTAWVVGSVSSIEPSIMREVDRLYVRKDVSEQRWTNVQEVLVEVKDQLRALRQDR